MTEDKPMNANDDRNEAANLRDTLALEFHSIRTRHSLATALLLLLTLVVAYLGCRIAIVHIVQDAAIASRLTVFIALVGAVMVLPIFWVQGRILLDPLSRMVRAVRKLELHHCDTDCPRIEWPGKDEFAMLAESVNRMLETVSARTVAVAHLEQRHKALIEGVPDAMLIFDRQGRLISVTKEAEGVTRLPGLRVGDQLNAKVYGAQAVDKFLSALAEAFREGRVSRAKLKVQPPRSEQATEGVRYFEARITRMDDRFALVVVRDVSDEVAEHKLRLEVERRAQDTSKRESLTLFASGIAHDMNNVLSVVLSAAESADADPSGDSVHTLNTIRDAIKKGSSMMKDLMTFAGVGRMTLMRASPKLVMEDVRPLASRVVGDNIVLSVGSADDAPDVDADPNQFWKVLFNIIKNAAEAIGPCKPGFINLTEMPFRMSADEATNFISEQPLQTGPGVLFRIEDDGPGIPSEILDRIFDPYVSSKALGRGLGLATVRTIIEAHNGGIMVKSRPDMGTNFLIFLPASRQPKDQTLERPMAENSAGAEALPRGVLMVDNDPAILKTTTILLKALKLEAYTAVDRHSALGVVRRHAADLRAILLDAHLGGIDTVRLLGAFRLGAPKVPVIVASGATPEEIEEMFRHHPYDAFLQKPYTLAELQQALAIRRGI